MRNYFNLEVQFTGYNYTLHILIVEKSVEIT